jgi:hypothetical protein
VNADTSSTGRQDRRRFVQRRLASQRAIGQRNTAFRQCRKMWV